MGEKKLAKKILIMLLFAILVISVTGCNKKEDTTKKQSGETTEDTTKATADTRTEEDENTESASRLRVSVHDPSIVKDGDTYYVFGSHIDAAKSTDLQNWTKFTNGYSTPGNVLYDDLSKNLAGSFAWAGENDADSKGGFSVWAPYVFYNADYKNEDGSKGSYMIYYCTSSTYMRSAIGYAVSQNIEGPYTYVDTIVYSGFTKGDAYDKNSTINTKYTNTNIQTLLDNGTLKEINNSWFTSNGQYNTSYSPNAIDPALFYDKDGTLYMTYGSWSGGIYMLEIDKTTGKALYPKTDGTTDGGNIIDRYFGIKIAGGYTKSGEGPYVVYDKETGYYYLYVSYAGLAANGGYNIRLFRSKNATGPYVDAAGNNATLPSSVDNSYAGIKLIGNYKFNNMAVGYKAGGHNSSFIDSDGAMYLVYHTRFDNGTENHEVRVHQMFINEEGWPVVAPYEYSGDKISDSGYSKEDIIGYYEFINHGTSNGTTMLDTMTVQLLEDGTVSGDVSGTWTMKDGTYYMSINIDNVTYKGVFFKQKDESKSAKEVMTFSAVGNNNQCIWGSKLSLNDKEAVEYMEGVLSNLIPDSVKDNLSLPTEGVNGTVIEWSSSDKKVITADGTINRQSEDKKVTLTANITKGKEKLEKTFDITVKKKVVSLSLKPIYLYDFEKSNKTEISNSGSKSGNATLMGKATVIKDKERGNVLSITNKNDAKKVNYLALPTDTFDGIGKDGYTVAMWVNVDTKDAGYWEHSALFEANAGGQDAYPVTRISANLFGRINSNGSYADATTITKGLEANKWQYVTYTVNPQGINVYLDGEVVGTARKGINVCFVNNFLAKMKDVRVGSGNIWGDEDIASAMFDNVTIYNKAFTEEEIETLYGEEVNQGK